MAVLGRLLISSAERLDLPDLLSIDSYAAGDFKFLLKGIVGDSRPYILKGFDVIDPLNAIGTQSCSIRVADSVVFYPGSNSGSFFHGLQEGHPQAAPVVPELRKNAVNYVYLTFSTFNSSVDTRAFWDPDKDGGAGGEFTQDVNTQSVLKVEVNVSTGSFPANTIPVAKITVGPVVITAIEDARDMMFRLGSGGISPNPFNQYQWRSLPSSPFQRSEPPTQMLAGGINPFQGADKNILTLKEWMDAIMTKLRELGGTIYWYEDTSTYSLISSFIDSNATAFKSKGKWIHDSSTPGLLTWTEDLNIKITSDQRTYIIRDGSKILADEQVMYLPMVRQQWFNATDEQVSWINGQNYVNTVGGAVGLFANLAKGDYIKKINDSNDKFLRVEEFYDAVSLGGSTTTPAGARSIRLSSVYLGTTGNEKGRYDKGVYLASDVLIADRDDAAISNIGGNFHWLAMRSDTIQNVGNIATTALTLDITDHDGSTAKVTSVAPHGLTDGDRLTIDNSTNFNGIYKVEVESPTVFYINVTGGTFADELGVDGFYAIVTTAARSTAYGLQLESANHGFNSNETIDIGGTVNYDDSYLINVLSATSFNIPVSASFAAETVGTATLAKVIVRRQGSVTQILQGENVVIGGTDADNIRQYTGMPSLASNAPDYTVPISYNTLDGMANYNGAINENLTARISKLTAMMADKAQDKTIMFLPSGFELVSNTTNGALQDINFSSLVPPGRLDIAMPGSDYNYGTILLGGTLSLAANQAAYFSVDRNATFNIASLAGLTVADITDVPVDENVFIFAIRLGTNDVWLWDSFHVSAGGSTPVPGYLNQIVQQNRNLKLIKGGDWGWDLYTSAVSSTATSYIQVPGLNDDRNQISGGLVAVLPNDGDVAYVDINRSSGPASILTVNVANISTITLNADRIIIARRLGDNVLVGSGTMLLTHWDERKLDTDKTSAWAWYIDITSSSLPTGANPLINGQAVMDGETVLFTQLNGIYMASNVGTSVTWTLLDAFLGGRNYPQEGETVYIYSNPSSEFTTKWVFDINQWKQADHSELVKEPTGFPNRIDSVVSFNDATRELTISPTSLYFDVYQKGKPYRFTSAQTYAIPNAQGLHYVYFNNGALASTQTFTPSIIKEYAFVATVYWDLANSAHIMLGDERHGIVMDGETHAYLHQAVGARYISGLSAGNFTIVGAGTVDTDAQISISGGIVRDEDIEFQITDSAAPSNPFEQILDPVAEIPVYYRSGPTGDWKKDSATTFPLKQGTSRIQWNDPAGPWTIQDASADGNYVAMWIFATNNQSEPIIAILGQREDTTLNNAQANNTYESVLFGDLPSAEMKVIYRLIFQTDSTFTNTPKAALVDVRDLRRAIDTSLGAYSPSDHGLLSGLTDQDHPDNSIFINNPASYVGGLKQIALSDNDDVEKALNSLDRFFAQMRMRPHPSDGNRVIMTGADQALTNGIVLTQTLKNLMVKFDGAEIDFSTGNVYESDGVTPLGISFTPATIAAGQYHWYSVTAIASSVNVDNTINIQLIVLSATGDGTTPALAPKAAYAKGMQIGQIYVQESGGGIVPIAAANIRQLGTGGSGSGSGEGDANELLERLKDRLLVAPFEWVEPNIFLTNEDDKIDTATATFDVANTLYKFTAAGQNIVSIQSLDVEFLTEEKDVDSIELMAFWDQAAIDANAIYEVSRNGGVDWETLDMSRVGSTTETFRGIIKFPQDTTYILLHEWAVANATSYREMNATTLQAIAQPIVVNADEAQVLQKSILYINKVGNPTGYTYLQLVKESGGQPSTDLLDVIAQAQVLNSSLAAGDNAITLNWGTKVVAAGTYYVVIATDSVYKSNFSAGVDSVRARVDAVAPIGTALSELNAGVWSTNASQTLIHRVEGRPLDLRVRITSSASNVLLKGYGIFYGRQEQVVGGLKSREVVQFDGTIDNFNEFTLTNFLPDPDLLRVYHVENGQVYVYGTGTLHLDGHKVVFPADTFNGLGTVTLVFSQLEGTSFDNSDSNAALLAANFLGSTDSSIDKSQNGRGIFLRRPDGTLREIAIDDNDDLVVYSV